MKSKIIVIKNSSSTSTNGVENALGYRIDLNLAQLTGTQTTLTQGAFVGQLANASDKDGKLYDWNGTAWKLVASDTDYLLTQYVGLREKQGKMITAFQTGHGWVKNGATAGVFSDDTVDYALGTQSIKYVTAGGYEAIRNYSLPSFDVSNKIIQIWVKFEADISNITNIEFQIGDSFLANRYSWWIHFQSSFIGTGKWTKITLPWSDANITGTAPDKTNITQAQIVMQSNASTSSTIRWGGFSLLDKNARLPNGAVCFGFDDSHVAHYNIAKPIMDKYGYAGTAFIVIDPIVTNQPVSMTVQNLKDMEKNSGWQISGHATSWAKHVSWDTLTDAEQTEEIAANKRWLVENGFKGAEYIAYPNGSFNDFTLSAVAKRFKGGRATKFSFETAACANPYIIRARVQLGTTTSAAQAQAAILKAYNNGDVVHVIVHNITSTPGTLNVTQADFTSIVDYCATIGIPVLTVSEVLESNDSIKLPAPAVPVVVANQYLQYVYLQYISVLLTNTVTETTLVVADPNNRGAVLIPANGLKVNERYIITVTGRYTTSATSNPITQRLKFGGVILMIPAPTAVVLPISQTNATFKEVYRIKVNSIGVAGNLQMDRSFEYANLTTGVGVLQRFANAGATTVDTTVASSFDYTAQWTTASASDSIQVRDITIEKE